MKMCLLFSLSFSLTTIAMESTNAFGIQKNNNFNKTSGWDEKDRAEHNRKYQEWI